MSKMDHSASQQNDLQTAPTTDPPSQVTQRRKKVSQPGLTRIRVFHVFILGGLGALGPLSNDLYLPGLPALSHDLNASPSQGQMTISACLLGLALGQLIAGPISDASGRRRPLLIGLVAYTLSSLLCSVAPSISILLGLRFVQGLAGATGIVIALAMVSDLYTGVVRARFFSLLAQVNGLAPLAAPLLGGQLLSLTSWHGLFVMLAIFAMVLLVAVALGSSETLEVSRRLSGDISSTLSSLRELVADPRFVCVTGSSGLAVAAGIIYITVAPFILENLYSVSPQLLGILFGISALAIVMVAQINGRLVGRWSSQKLLIWGYGIMTLGSTGLLLCALSGIGLIGMMIFSFIFASSLGLIFPNSTTLALTNARAAGSASALLGVVQAGLGALVAPLVGLGGTMTALPMAASIAAFAMAALVTFITFYRPTRRVA